MDETYEVDTFNSVNFTNGGATVSAGGNDTGNTLVITGVTADWMSQDTVSFGIAETGTSSADAFSGKGMVAGGDTRDAAVSGSTVTVKLYRYDSSGRWTDSGTYDVYVVLGTSPSNATFYRKQNVTFSSGTATISVNDLVKLQ
ncbi:MAG: hypothetical protein LBP80_01825 [Treponema sp.]|jgi:hypothetical protein|nr:hypothetical protein [Treponema sp.]